MITTTYTFTPTTAQCAVATTMTITVSNGTTPTFTQVPAICSGAPLTGLPTTSNNGINGVWSPTLNNIATTTYTFTPNTGQCAINTTMVITVNNSPVIQITDPDPICEPSTIDLTSPSIIAGSTVGGIFSYWTNLNATNPLTNNTAISGSGTYYIQNTVQGCSAIAPVNVVLFPKPIASFSTSTNNIDSQNPTCSMINNSSGSVNYNWSFGDGQSSNLESPVNTYTITDQSTFIITLVAVSQFGCTSSTSHEIEVKEELIYYVPNSFTPDGDRYNPIFQPIFTSGYDPETYKLSIFNRWGEIVFQTDDVTQGWDGINSKTNTLLSDGTYSWKIEFHLKNSGHREEIYGHINLLK